MRWLDRFAGRWVPDIVWEFVIAIFATQIGFSVARILQSGGRPLYINSIVFLVLMFFASIGVAGGIFGFVYVATYAATRALARRKPEPKAAPAPIIHLPGDRIAG